MNLFDCWTRENQWLTLGDIVKLLCIPSSIKGRCHWRYQYIEKQLRQGVNGNILLTKRVKRQIKGSYGTTQVRMVNAYQPKDWVLKSVCDGFFVKRCEELEVVE